MLKYFDLDDILLEEQKIKIRLKSNISFPHKVEANTTFEAPLFSLEHIINDEECEILSDIVSLETQHILRANALPEDFTKQNPNFYALVKYFYNDLSFFKKVAVRRVNFLFECLIQKKEINELFFEKEKEIYNEALETLLKFNSLGKL
ncbi:hypothetical protein TUBRATIS_23540 [Tubulinosema ratisbonensis]|uniref:GINS subunit domain-containing protein n=1 Tax=Tubulinosema ratisbonensis TaxID=291195 RepID=A0A437AJD2_9MICR|nr:hypothetical protein TUBRATIS_23540 [Tubulinosema ratisbonensis]